MDGDIGHAFRQALAGADVERHIGPAPVVDENLQRGVGVDVRIGIDVHFLAIRDRLLAEDRAIGVLAANGGIGLVAARELAKRAQHFHLFVAHGVGFERDRRLHADQRDELQHVVLDDVARDAGGLEVRPALFHAD